MIWSGCGRIARLDRGHFECGIRIRRHPYRRRRRFRNLPSGLGSGACQVQGQRRALGPRPRDRVSVPAQLSFIVAVYGGNGHFHGRTVPCDRGRDRRRWPVDGVERSLQLVIFQRDLKHDAHFLLAGLQCALPIAGYILGLQRASRQRRESHHPQRQLFHRRPPVSFADQIKMMSRTHWLNNRSSRLKPARFQDPQ